MLGISAIGEFGLIERLASLAGHDNSIHGIGDDAAVIDLPGPEYLLATVDMQVEGVHFSLDRTEAGLVGRRAMAVNISDIAAMGGIPEHALVSLALPTDTLTTTVEELYRGLVEEAAQFETHIVGGNVTRTDGPLAIDITVLGHIPKDQLLLRSGARPGDVLAVTGSLGIRAALLRASMAGLDLSRPPWNDWAQRNYVPAPRVSAARALASNRVAHAMMDISDGLAGDVRHLARASGVGVVLDESALPIDAAVRDVADLLGIAPEDLALNGGEDYELLLALPPDAAEEARRLMSGLPLTVVAKVVNEEDGLTIRSGAGERRVLPEAGWRHF